MSVKLTERVIKLLCGRRAFEEGEACVRADKVTLTGSDPDAPVYEAAVAGRGRAISRVTVEIDGDGDVYADCDCPAFCGSGVYCGHIAAVLIYLHDRDNGSRPPIRAALPPLETHEDFSGKRDRREPRTTGASQPDGAAAAERLRAARDAELVSGLIGLFGDRPLRPSGAGAFVDTREPLKAEFTLRTVPSGGQTMFGVEMKAGTKRLYPVSNIADFLEAVSRREPFTVSRHFRYEPGMFCFGKEDDAVLRQLVDIAQNESVFREPAAGRYAARPSRASGSRLLLVPPFAWEPLLPLLAAVPSARLETPDGTAEGIRVSDEPLPVRFEFGEAEPEPDGQGDCTLEVHGLETLTVMEPYGVVLFADRLLQPGAEACRRLAELNRMLAGAGIRHIRVPAKDAELFLEKAVPGLMKLGSVRIAASLSERIVRLPLKARVYLDRVRDRLLAGLEFQYGDIVLNPLDGSGRQRGEERILMRDGEREERILGLMDQGDAVKTEGGYILAGEEAEYEFLYRIVPELEKLADIYATSAVKSRLHAGRPPKVTVEVDERTDWLEVRFDLEAIPPSEIREVLRSLEEKRRFHRLPSGALMPLETAELQAIARVLNELGTLRGGIPGMDAPGVFRLPAHRGLRLIHSDLEGGAVRLGKSLRRLLDDMRSPDSLDFPLPDGLKPVLRDYQRLGYQWLRTLAHYRFGGILADDMGLGKTVQSIAFLVSMLPEIRARKQPALIVTPASLMYNWLGELGKFAPEVRAVVADGGRAERGRELRRAMAEADVVITSYPLLRRDVERYAEHRFHTLILDEAQAFKNYATQTAQAVKAVSAAHRFALTGTPVENRSEELWSIFDAVFPELFQDRQSFLDLSREAAAKRARPFLLRRLKSDVLSELPEKIETVQSSKLLPEQKKLYAAYLAQLQHETLKHLSEDGFQKYRIKILAGLTRLRQLCCHPALFVEGYKGGSAKFEQLLEIVEECRSAGKRLLVFSQFTSMLRLIGRELGVRGVPFFYLDGETPADERIRLCDRFNAGERELFLLSLKAGGTGLNLTGADTVILYDLWWNPAVEQQAADRAHRIGQRSVVQVIRLVAQGTVEDSMYKLQQRKRSLIDEMVAPGGGDELSALGEREIRDILQLEQTGEKG
ncbi:DEAD/DEAH box helicase [Paenibacillus humicola]|uniref:DEAD/DEAH box helicase n=1 Tax=Paenibacillus humicola TaxID=3110540 RepID=UPI00237B44C2|nr:DEAD/DEAH box helicase [Paenibacillus humicola]